MTAPGTTPPPEPCGAPPPQLPPWAPAGLLLASAVTPVLAYLGWLVVVATAMACDPCTGDQLAAFDRSYEWSNAAYRVGLLIPAGLLLTAWTRAMTGKTDRIGRPALLAPASLPVLVLVCLVIVDWP